MRAAADAPRMFSSEPIVDQVRPRAVESMTTRVRAAVAALPSMMGRGGRIINMLSTVIEEPNWRWHTYGAAKGALWQMTRHLAAETGPHNITVNMVSPGLVETPQDDPKRAAERRQHYAIDHIPMRRPGTPEDIVKVKRSYTGQFSAPVLSRRANKPKKRIEAAE